MAVQTVHCAVSDEPVPDWARLERTLIDEMNAAVDPFLDRYVNEDGTVMWPPADDYVGMDAVDDAYEGFHNWPLFYVLGGGEHVLERAREEWEAITEQFAEIPTGLGHPQIVREYQQGHDWFHQSEGNLLFYHLCLADPTDEAFRERATRFADLYTNDRPDAPDNYDAERRLVKSPMNGSMGPASHNFSTDVPPAQYGAHSESRIPWTYEEWKEAYGLPYYDLNGIDSVADLEDETKARRMGEAIQDRCAKGDVPANLGITSLVTNAYLTTGESKYHDWVVDYVEAWADRARRNGGLLPDNVDRNDVIGGEFETSGEGMDAEFDIRGEEATAEGRWFGGWYGWTWPHGWHGFGNAVVAAAENAFFLEQGDDSYLDLPRSQLDLLADRGHEEADGVFRFPYRYATDGEYPRERGQDPDSDAGWFDYRPADLSEPTHLWFLSQDAADWRRLKRLRSSDREDWEAGLQSGLKDFGGNADAWTAYLNGAYPAYPERVLSHNLSHVRERRVAIDEDDQDPSTYGDYYLAERNPITVEGLVQCTTGSPLALWNGGLPIFLIRHFNPVRRRPGLPPDIAALVTGFDDDSVSFTVVNTGDQERRTLVQAGGFAEHRFTSVTQTGDDGVGEVVDAGSFALDVPPGKQVELTAGIDRFVSDPGYAAPWNRESE
jgi:hypothetical protein